MKVENSIFIHDFAVSYFLCHSEWDLKNSIYMLQNLSRTNKILSLKSTIFYYHRKTMIIDTDP
jgi:hypothetical protein